MGVFNVSIDSHIYKSANTSHTHVVFTNIEEEEKLVGQKLRLPGLVPLLFSLVSQLKCPLLEHPLLEFQPCTCGDKCGAGSALGVKKKRRGERNDQKEYKVC